ncbi:peptidylprolyl isomerase [Sphingomonas telluris]|jgi:peptidylprolyl isomerase|uniref:peptidylprolyl isomerase n=1 Tax=Sphingomonas telluris TaxID=2907998 RepID=UPI003F4F983D
MIARVLLSFAAIALVAAKPGPQAPAVPVQSSIAPPEVANDPQNRLTLELSNGGTVVILLRPDVAPLHVERMRQLAKNGFYDGLKFHRVIPGFMAQSGDPKGTGEGGSTLPNVKAEFSSLPFMRGTLGAARADGDVDSANSQFFIAYGPNAMLDKHYTIYGRVISGMDAVDKIAPGEPPAEPTTIVHARIGN